MSSPPPRFSNSSTLTRRFGVSSEIFESSRVESTDRVGKNRKSSGWANRKRREGGEVLPLPRLSSRRWPPLRWPTGRPEPSFRGSPLIRGKFADTDNRLIAAAMETYHVPTKLGWRNSAPVKSTGRSIENEKDPARNSTNVPRPLFTLRENFKNLRSLKISFRWRV